MKKIDISEFLILPDIGENLTEKIQQAIDKCAIEKCILNVVKVPSQGFYDGEEWGCVIGGVILS